jgi:hypothetical protein
MGAQFVRHAVLAFTRRAHAQFDEWPAIRRHRAGRWIGRDPARAEAEAARTRRASGKVGDLEPNRPSRSRCGEAISGWRCAIAPLRRRLGAFRVLSEDVVRRGHGCRCFFSGPLCQHSGDRRLLSASVAMLLP